MAIVPACAAASAQIVHRVPVDLVHYVQDNPSVFASLIATLGSIAVGLATFLGVRLSLAHSRERMNTEIDAANGRARDERDFAAAEAVRVRLAEMRKDLYLTFVDEFQKALAVVTAMPGKRMSELQSELARLQPLAAAASKTWLVSEVDTAGHAIELNAKLNELMFELVGEMPRSDDAAYAIERAMSESAETESTLQRLYDEHAAMHAKGAMLSRASSQLDNQIVTGKTRLSLLEKELLDARAEKNEADALLRLKLMESVRSLNVVLQNFMVSARRELGNQADAEKIAQVYEQMFSRAGEALQKLLKSLNLGIGGEPETNGPVPIENA